MPWVTGAYEGNEAAGVGEADKAAMILEVKAEGVTRCKKVTNGIRVCVTSHTHSLHVNFISLYIYMQK